MAAGERREQLLDVAREVVDRDGFRAVTIERVAKEARVTRTVVYQQFGTLGALLVAMVDREYAVTARGFAEAVARPVPSSEPHPFAAALGGVLDAAARSPASWRMLLLPSEGGPPELYERLAEARATARRYIDVVLAAHPVDVFAGANDPALAAHVLHTIAEELVRLHLRDPTAFSAARLLAQARSMVTVVADAKARVVRADLRAQVRKTPKEPRHERKRR